MSVVHWALSPGGRPACGRGSRPQVQTAVEQCKVTCSWCRREIEREPVTCRAERQVAAVENALRMMRVREDFLRASHRMDEAKIAEACVFDIRTALETE